MPVVMGGTASLARSLLVWRGGVMTSAGVRARGGSGSGEDWGDWCKARLGHNARQSSG